MKQLNGNKKKVVVLTGCTGQLGTYFTHTHNDRYTIIGIARNKPETYAGDAFFQADITENPSQIINSIMNEYGCIDVLVNNAAIYGHGQLTGKQTDVFTEELKTNCVAPLALSNSIFERFWLPAGVNENKLMGRGVVNVSSIAGIQMYSAKGSYSTTKAALNMLTKHMALEYYNYGIRVNALAPNTFPTLISLEKVVSSMVDLIEGSMNGVIMVLDKNKEYFL